MTEERESYGFVLPSSTSTEIKVATMKARNQTPIIGQMVFLDQVLDNGYVYRCLGTVTEITTQNHSVSDPNIASVMSRDLAIADSGADLKTLSMKVQATYSSNDNGNTWVQEGSGLPSSPDTRTRVNIMEADVMENILGPKMQECSYVGTFRGLKGVHLPMNIPGFASRRGATHQAIVGRSGSGKTAFSHTLFFAQMRNESHGFIVIDPQGQWSSESGFLFSLQAAARALGREVHVLRVSEDIRLPRSTELLAHMMNELNLWRSMTRMGDENSQALSAEVAKHAIAALKADDEIHPREVLIKAFREIVRSKASMGRIYARGGDAGETLRQLLCYITDEPYYNKKGEEEAPTTEDIDDARHVVDSVLTKFLPLVNLFTKKNLAGGNRRALGGDYGFLSGVLKTRGNGEVGPYVVLDMSSDTRLNARAEYARSTRADEGDGDSLTQMRAMLDNPEVKAHIVGTVLDEVKKRAESEYANDGGNLDTQIIFDEAWRYAPNPGRISRRSPIHALTERLAGYALDTRKYGIGWTYILQSPDDLNSTIWRQLTYVYAGHGMVGSDRSMLSDLMDDSSQLRLYDQFSDPNATGIYPFMVTGPVNPLIFTATPTFFNVFSDPAELLRANAQWIDAICDRRSLPRFSNNPAKITLGSPVSRNRSAAPSVARTVPTSPVLGVPTVSDGNVKASPF